MSSSFLRTFEAPEWTVEEKTSLKALVVRNPFPTWLTELKAYDLRNGHEFFYCFLFQICQYSSFQAFLDDKICIKTFGGAGNDGIAAL